jgi:hypothetical protein
MSELKLITWRPDKRKLAEAINRECWRTANETVNEILRGTIFLTKALSEKHDNKEGTP